MRYLANRWVPAPRRPPDDYDLEEWGRYGKQAALRRQLNALALDLDALSQGRFPAAESDARDLLDRPASD